MTRGLSPGDGAAPPLPLSHAWRRISLLGSFQKRARAQRAQSLEWVFELFPILRERRNQLAYSLLGRRAADGGHRAAGSCRAHNFSWWTSRSWGWPPSSSRPS
ncbi:MAG: hypothetical protein MZV64_17025 [Ignavibacteriales bacterium]|nr:hypothetical protein [Ignavibacteriales bacterium]